MRALGVFLFHTTSAALRAEKLLLAEQFDIKLIPTPRQFSSNCGLAVRFAWDQREAVQAVLEAARVEVASVHRLT